ncbi:Uncharacterised protein [Vibrio cholerae]|nr:Uncharacterised protein [Vibrio cholerae]
MKPALACSLRYARHLAHSPLSTSLPEAYLG